MSFTLKVEFSGLCGYLRHPDDMRIGIILPDARRRRDVVMAEDGSEPLVWHVGYLRYDLDDLAATGVPSPIARADGAPSSEVVHRFDFEEMDFGLDDAPLGRVEPNLPIVEKFAPDVRPVPGLFGTTPSRDLLMRCVLKGGSVSSRVGNGVWRFSTVLNPGAPAYESEFAGVTLWTREVADKDQLELTLRNWDGSVKRVITLRPRTPGGEITLKVGNLCSDNPLEWPEMFLRVFQTGFDKDFKWFYRLWDLPGGGFGRVIREDTDRLPAPELIDSKGGGIDDCTAADMVHAFDTGAHPDDAFIAQFRALQGSR